MIDIRTGKHFTTPSARSQMTRGGFLRGGIASIIAAKSAPYIAVSSAVLAGSANGGVARGMMRGVGGRFATIGGYGGLSAKSYVQDGLVAMWDGVENAGWGTHNPSATVWKDLGVNGLDLEKYSTSTGSVTWSNDAIVFDASYFMSKKTSVLNQYISAGNYTIEACGMFTSTPTSALCLSVFVYAGGVQPTLSKNGWGVINIWGGQGLSLSFNERFATSFVMDKDRSVNEVYKNSQKTLERQFKNTSSNALLIGNTSNGPGMNGEINNVRIYDRVLSQQQIDANYAIDKARFGIT